MTEQAYAVVSLREGTEETVSTVLFRIGDPIEDPRNGQLMAVQSQGHLLELLELHNFGKQYTVIAHPTGRIVFAAGPLPREVARRLARERYAEAMNRYLDTRVGDDAGGEGLESELRFWSSLLLDLRSEPQPGAERLFDRLLATFGNLFDEDCNGDYTLMKLRNVLVHQTGDASPPALIAMLRDQISLLFRAIWVIQAMASEITPEQVGVDTSVVLPWFKDERHALAYRDLLAKHGEGGREARGVLYLLALFPDLHVHVQPQQIDVPAILQRVARFGTGAQGLLRLAGALVDHGYGDTSWSYFEALDVANVRVALEALLLTYRGQGLEHFVNEVTAAGMLATEGN